MCSVYSDKVLFVWFSEDLMTLVDTGPYHWFIITSHVILGVTKLYSSLVVTMTTSSVSTRLTLMLFQLFHKFNLLCYIWHVFSITLNYLH